VARRHYRQEGSVISAIALAIAAFVVSWKQRSFAVVGLLAASGIILLVLPLIALTSTNFTVIGLQGPLVGVTFGLVILGLGVAKGIETTRTTAATCIQNLGNNINKRIVQYLLEHSQSTLYYIVNHSKRAPSAISYHINRLKKWKLITLTSPHNKPQAYKL
jgi:hypothetical protein